MDIRYSPYSSPFVPRSPEGVYWVARELQYAPHDEHVRVFLAHRQSMTADLSRRYAQQKRDKVMYLLDDLAAHGVQAARARLNVARRAEHMHFGGSIAGEKGALDVGHD
jgi:hypothetical protein